MSLDFLHNAIGDWSLGTQRPFSSFGTTEIELGALEGLATSMPDLETTTLALAELKNRTRHAARLAEDDINDRLQQINHQPIPWLLRVRENLKILTFEDEPNKNYTSSLYVILRDGYTEQNGRYGLYVGETSKTVGERFKQHLNGIDAGRGLPEHGMQSMYSLMWPWQQVPGAKRLFYEAALHKALELNNINGPKISGNAEAVEKWPEGFQTTLQKKL